MFQMFHLWNPPTTSERRELLGKMAEEYLNCIFFEFNDKTIVYKFSCPFCNNIMQASIVTNPVEVSSWDSPYKSYVKSPLIVDLVCPTSCETKITTYT